MMIVKNVLFPMLVVTIRGRGWRNQNFPGLKRANDSAWGSTFLHNARWVVRKSICGACFLSPEDPVSLD